MFGVQNRVDDALSQQHNLQSSMEVKLVSFGIVKELYENDSDFGEIWL